MDLQDADEVGMLEEDMVVDESPEQLPDQLLLLLGHLDWQEGADPAQRHPPESASKGSSLNQSTPILTLFLRLLWCLHL